jgi:hypothetical protein
MSTKVEYFPARGGVNLSVPPWAVKSGEILLGLNYECTPEGYRRIDGYERFDGRPSPSSGSATQVYFAGGQIEPPTNSRVYGSVSGASGIVDSIVITSGSWLGNDAVGYINLSDVYGDFTTDDQLIPGAGGSAFDDGFNEDYA